MSRRLHDFYETPEYYVRLIQQWISSDKVIFEPCAGDHAIARFYPVAETNDLDPTRPADFHFDAAEPWPFSKPFDAIVTNPPFKQAFPILQQCLLQDPVCPVALLLRLSFFEPTRERATYLGEHPPSGLIYLPRYSFTGNGKSDSTTCVWGLWNLPINPPIQIAPRFP